MEFQSINILKYSLFLVIIFSNINCLAQEKYTVIDEDFSGNTSNWYFINNGEEKIQSKIGNSKAIIINNASSDNIGGIFINKKIDKNSDFFIEVTMRKYSGDKYRPYGLLLVDEKHTNFFVCYITDGGIIRIGFKDFTRDVYLPKKVTRRYRHIGLIKLKIEQIKGKLKVFLGEDEIYARFYQKNNFNFDKVGIVAGKSISLEVKSFKLEKVFNRQRLLSSSKYKDYIRNYVEGKMNLWLKKGEFETTNNYNQRVSDSNKSKKIKEYETYALIELKRNFNRNINWDKKEISNYDADNQTFKIKIDLLNEIILNVPLEDAKNFKSNWNSLEFRFEDFVLTNKGFQLSDLYFYDKSFDKGFWFHMKDENNYLVNQQIEYRFNNSQYNPKIISNSNNNKSKVQNLGISEIVDVDINIPNTKRIKKNRYALIIGNEDYSSKQKGLTIEQDAEFALNDAVIFSKYCENILGIPIKQIRLLKNATAAEMHQGLAWLSNLAKIENGNAEIYFYYSGHGLPLEKTNEPYLIPVDVSGNNVEFGISLQETYEKLNEYKSRRVNVFLDACFSGGARNQGLIAIKGIKVKPKRNLIPGNIIVFSSSSNEESSLIYNEKQHGYFTYFLLKKLKETKGKVNYKELSDYIIERVRKTTALKGKIQTPEINTGISVKEFWQKWNFNK